MQVITSCQSPVFCWVFGLEDELEDKFTVTIVRRRRKNRKNAKIPVKVMVDILYVKVLLCFLVKNFPKLLYP